MLITGFLLGNRRTGGTVITGEYITDGILYPLVWDIISLILIRSILFSILAGNITSKKATYNKAYKIAGRYSLGKRLNQSYILDHISKHVRAYHFYMRVKKAHIVWMILTPVIMALAQVGFVEQQEVLSSAANVRLGIALLFCIVLLSKFGIDRKTKFER